MSYYYVVNPEIFIADNNVVLLFNVINPETSEPLVFKEEYSVKLFIEN